MTLPLAPFGPRTGLRGMVAAADQLAASAGIGLLARGGSAADAAVATGAVMAVVGPHLCGLGGDVLAMVAPPGSTPEALLSVGRAGAGSDPARLRAEGMTTMPLRGDIRSVQVPGAVDGWLALHARHGRLPLDDVLAPAIELAYDGFAASIMLALASHLVHALPGRRASSARTARSRSANACGCPGSPARCAPSPATAATASTRASSAGACSSSAAAISPPATSPRQRGRAGAHPAAAAWGHDLWTVPPPSQGYLTLAGAVVAEAAGLGTDPDDPRWAHLLVEAWRAVGPRPPGDALRRRRREPRCSTPTAWPPPRPGWPASGRRRPTWRRGHGTAGPAVARLGDGDTTHLCALDADGLGVSLTQSNALDFGSHLIEPATGVFLHNRGVGLLARRRPPGRGRARAGARRTPSPPCWSPRPDGALTHLVGAMGGDAQPQIIVQLLARLLHAGQDPATAVAAPRLTLDAPSAGPFRLWWGDDLTVLVEADAPPAWAGGLAERGHRVRAIGAFDPVAVGCAQIIAVEHDPAGGRLLVAASDPSSP